VKVLGVDPGSRAAGWAVVEFSDRVRLVAAGVLRPDTSESFSARLLALRDGLIRVIDREKPDAAAVEKVFSGKNPQSLILLGEARGVLLLALAERGIATHEITPAEIKRAVAGSGVAEKVQVRRMVASLVEMGGVTRLAIDAADAAAAALAHGFVHARRAPSVVVRASSHASGLDFGPIKRRPSG
jgi:crossover junction endodeoxyribonuclease RuvC